MPRIPPDSTTALEIELAAAWPVYRWGRTRQLVAVSGGADSVALLRALLRLAPDPSLIDAAHFNHGWRGDESDGDEYFVRELCQLLGVRLFVERASETLSEAVAHGRSEAEARNLRYDFLARTAYRSGARYVLTAHTASDRVETLLHNLFRGSGLGGVATLGLVRPLDQQLVLARPLISCSREQVLDHLSQLGQPCRQDASNDNLAFRRNYIRHQLLPLLREQYGPQLDARLLS
ncbi:MAG: tRNA lysidine(34) synthetase TilS, partial [Planctomycetales bacterium]|nr:tRNA lysidine(34) synthetase TilS [Planctomycetales bacterium]